MKKTVKAIITAAIATTVLAQTAFAWGPERETYTNAEPAASPVFNSITDNSTIKDERDFVRVAEDNGDEKYTWTNHLEIEPGKKYRVIIYYHNNAASNFNDEEHNYAGIAREVKVKSSFPEELKKGEEGTVYGEIDSESTNPEAVWDEAYFTATKDMTLKYVEESATIYNGFGISGTTLSTDLFTSEGTYLGAEALDGVVPGCSEYSGQVVYSLTTESAEQPILERIMNNQKLVIAIIVVLIVVFGSLGFLLGKKQRK